MEFEDRENSSLGDLPKDIMREQRLKRPLYNKPSRAVYEGKHDILYADQQLKKPTQLGSVPYTANVVATFDSRFINGLDFINSNFETWNITANPPATLNLESEFIVPGGYVAVVRRFRYEMYPVVPIEPDDLILDWQVDEVTVLDNDQLKSGQISGWIDTFFLARPSAVIKAKFRAPTGIASLITDTRKILIEIQGNLIQDTGVDLPEEIANPDQGLSFIGKGRDKK